MSLYNQEYNKDHVVLRYLLVSLLEDLRNKVYFYNIYDNETKSKVNIPFYYSITGSERFLTDNFVYDSQTEGKAIGDYEQIPRSILQMNSLSIDSSEMVNKFIPAEFIQQKNDKLKSVKLNTNFLPINISYDTTIVCSNSLEMLKATESVISKLYKSNIYYVDLGMCRIDASYQIPEDFSLDKLFDFSFDDKKEFNVTFPLEVSTFLPVIEDGILLSELSDFDFTNGVFEKFDTTSNDISISPHKNIQSNIKGSVNTKNKIGNIYNIDRIQSIIDKEDIKGKKWRNIN